MSVRYDVVVVGGGTAGAIIAARLSEDPQRSRAAARSRAGLRRPGAAARRRSATATRRRRTSLRATTTGASPAGRRPWPGRCWCPGARLTGGSSAVNGEIFLRGIPEDFDAWAARATRGGASSTCCPSFCRLERDLDFRTAYHGARGPIPVRRFAREAWLAPQVAFHAACVDAGFADCPDLNAPDASGVGPIPLNNLDGVRWSTNLGYLDPARHRLNLTVRPHCTAVGLVFEGQRATGVRVESGGERFVVRGGEIVLSAGAVGSPHLLLLSGIGPADRAGGARTGRPRRPPRCRPEPARPPARLRHLASGVRLPHAARAAPVPDLSALLQRAAGGAVPPGPAGATTCRS